MGHATKRRVRVPAMVLVCTALASVGCDSILGLDDYTSAAPQTATTASTGGGGTGGVGGGSEPPSTYLDAVMADMPAAYWRLGDATGRAELTVKNEAATIDGVLSGPFVLGVKGLLATDEQDTAVALGDGAGLDAGNNFDFHSLSPFTIELWLKPSAIDEGRNLVRKLDLDPTYGYEGWQLSIGQSPTSAVVLMDRWLDGAVDTAEMGPLAEQATVYVAATYDSAQICVYLDDLAPACVPSTKSVKAHGASLLVGFVGTSGGFEGVIDELAIYTHALTPQRIREHYLAGNGP